MAHIPTPAPPVHGAGGLVVRDDGDLEIRLTGADALDAPGRELLAGGVRSFAVTLTRCIDRAGFEADEDSIGAAGVASARTAAVVLEAIESKRDVLRDVPRARREPIGRAMGQIAELVVQSALERHLKTAELEQRLQSAVDAYRVILTGDRRQLASIIDALEPVTIDDPAAVDPDEAEARARLRLHALYQRILRDSYSVKDLAEWGLSRQRLKQLRDELRLFAIRVPYHKGLVYPRWQFGSDHRPRVDLPTLIAAARDSGMDAITFHQTMTNPDAGNGRSPVELLDAGRQDQVLGILRAADR